MAKRTAFLTLFAITLFVAVCLSAFAERESVEIIIENWTAYTIREVNASVSEEGEWGHNLIAGESIDPNQSLRVFFPAESQNLRARLAVGGDLVDVREVGRFRADTLYQWTISVDRISYEPGGAAGHSYGYQDPYGYYSYGYQEEGSYGYLGGGAYGYLQGLFGNEAAYGYLGGE